MSFGGKSGGSKIESKEEITGRRNPITWYKSKVGTYPSNVQTWWAMKRPVQATPDNLQKDYLEVFDPALRDQVTFGNTLAPKGHYLFNAFNLDRSGESDVGGLPVESSNGMRPKVCAFFAGRIFYAGTQSGKWNSRVYFSQILERDDQVGMCYQQQDPTSEDVPDLLPSDGGVIVIPEIAEIIKMVNYNADLYIFASNGVWRVAGSDGSGFQANDYAVARISTVPAYGPHSFVETEAGLLWWSRSGIWALAPDQTGMSMQVQSMTNETIKEFFETIPNESKKFAKGAYNQKTKVVQWIYRSTAPGDDVVEQYTYDRILNFGTRTGAFYPWRPISEELSEKIMFSGIIALAGDATIEETVQVYTSESEEDPVVISPLVGVLTGATLDDTVASDGDDVVSGSMTADDIIYVMALVRYKQAVENKFKYIILRKDAV